MNQHIDTLEALDKALKDVDHVLRLFDIAQQRILQLEFALHGTRYTKGFFDGVDPTEFALYEQEMMELGWPIFNHAQRMFGDKETYSSWLRCKRKELLK